MHRELIDRKSGAVENYVYQEPASDSSQYIGRLQTHPTKTNATRFPNGINTNLFCNDIL